MGDINNKQTNIKKNILIIDDSALMRRVLCDIINSDSRYIAKDCAADGLIALKMLSGNQYDAIILDINMPNMNGIEFLKELRRRKIWQRVIVFSTDTIEGAEITITALELGALEFIHKPSNMLDSKKDEFKRRFLDILSNVISVPLEQVAKQADKNVNLKFNSNKNVSHTQGVNNDKIDIHSANNLCSGKGKLVAIACSTGGPKALQRVIPYLPYNLDAPVLVVQHMPAGFTASLANRLDSISQIDCSEAKEHEIVKSSHVYIACGGKHLKINSSGGQQVELIFGDEPPREGVKPCANYMYESLVNSEFDEIICVVMTGMGSDGTKGIQELAKHKKVYIIAQDADSSTVYGMPKSIAETGLVNQIVDLDHIAKEIINKVGVK